jgi:hypothetical protein
VTSRRGAAPGAPGVRARRGGRAFAPRRARARGQAGRSRLPAPAVGRRRAPRRPGARSARPGRLPAHVRPRPAVRLALFGSGSLSLDVATRDGSVSDRRELCRGLDLVDALHATASCAMSEATGGSAAWTGALPGRSSSSAAGVSTSACASRHIVNFHEMSGLDQAGLQLPVDTRRAGVPRTLSPSRSRVRLRTASAQLSCISRASRPAEATAGNSPHGRVPRYGRAARVRGQRSDRHFVRRGTTLLGPPRCLGSDGEN